MADPVGPVEEVRVEESVYIYRLEKETNLPIIIGKVFIDKDGDAWVRINSTDLAEGLGVQDIDGVALMDRERFNSMEV